MVAGMIFNVAVVLSWGVDQDHICSDRDHILGVDKG